MASLLKALCFARAGAFRARSEKGLTEEALEELENVEDERGEVEAASLEPDDPGGPDEDERAPRPKRKPRLGDRFRHEYFDVCRQ